VVAADAAVVTSQQLVVDVVVATAAANYSHQKNKRFPSPRAGVFIF